MHSSAKDATPAAPEEEVILAVARPRPLLTYLLMLLLFSNAPNYFRVREKHLSQIRSRPIVVD
uniref:Uncharacterized protein n=1 Tax=Daphnia magna TaxID=35525 RepID=A0A0P6ICH4_9CRUS